MNSITPPTPSAGKATGADAERAEIVAWRNTKAQREIVRAKFGGRCAYCGTDIDRMHCDHLEPCVRVMTDEYLNPLPASEHRMMRPERNVLGNMMPACVPCNLHKGGYKLEQWRDILQRSAAILRRDTSTFRAGERFGVIVTNEVPVTFYFERGDHKAHAS